VGVTENAGLEKRLEGKISIFPIIIIIIAIINNVSICSNAPNLRFSAPLLNYIASLTYK